MTAPTNPSQSPDAAGSKTPLWLRLIGVRRRPGRWIRFVPSRWGWLIVVGVVLLSAMVGFAEYSMQPEFCRTCHLMEPYYQAWHDSTHKDVPCGDCHFEPGWRNTIKGKWQASSQAVKYITQTYGSKPHGEVHDASCLRSGCHDQRLLEGKVDWTVQTQRGHDITIHFDHAPHLGEMRRGKELRCVSCHSQMVQGQHIVVTLDTCFLCHFKGLEHGRDDQTIGGCRSCHDAPKQEIELATGMFKHSDYIDRGVTCQNCHVEVVSGDGAVPRQFCWTCHNQEEHLSRYGETKLMHRNHVTDHKVECASCHVQIVHHLAAGLSEGGSMMTGPKRMMLTESGDCSQCHDRLHNAPVNLYQGSGGRGVPDMPSPMYRAQVDCVACHRSRQHKGELTDMTGETFVADTQACNDCHAKEYSRLVDDWKRAVTGLLTQADQVLDEAQMRFGDEPLAGPEALRWQRVMDDARHNVALVRSGHGVHNVNYAVALLHHAIDTCRQLLGKPPVGTDDGSTAYGPSPPTEPERSP